MQGYVYQSDFARKYYSQGREEGIEEGRGRGLRAAVRALLDAKLGMVTEDEAAAIEVMDARQATELLGMLGRGASDTEVRACLAAVHVDR